MANTFVNIASTYLSSTTTSVTFSSIPATYTDLVVITRTRGDVSASFINYLLTVNGTSSQDYLRLYGNQSTITASRNTTDSKLQGYYPGTPASSNLFAVHEFYFANYLTNVPKQFFMKGATPILLSDANENWLWNQANAFNSTSAISSIQLQAGSGNFVTGSSFYLYGIKNS